VPEQQRYLVTSAIRSSPRKGESVWTVTFTPRVRPAGLPFDPEAGKTLVITVSPRTVDELFFDGEYTREGIEALERSH
jgi:hypothetical protein